MSDGYEYKVQFRTSDHGSWLDSRTFTDVINARVFKRQLKALHKSTEFRIVRRPNGWEVCE